jgi:hypothetical protein
VEAIFSPSQEEERDPRFLTGLTAITAGGTLWLILILDTYLKPFGTPIIGSYLSTLLSSFGLIFVISGAGTCTAFSFIRPVSEDQEMNTSDLISASGALPNGKSSHRETVKPRKSRIRIWSDPSTKFGLVAFVQSCIAIALYSGLADEYQSNIRMQLWIRTVFPSARYLLTWEAVLIASAVLGFLITRFLPGRALAE